MPDLTFLSRVAALLLSQSDESPSQARGDEPERVSWPGTAGLLSVVQARFAGDPEAKQALTAARRGDRRSRIRSVAMMAAAIRTHAERDQLFCADVLCLMVDAYAHPGMARMLPDPAPHV